MARALFAKVGSDGLCEANDAKDKGIELLEEGVLPVEYHQRPLSFGRLQVQSLLNIFKSSDISVSSVLHYNIDLAIDVTSLLDLLVHDLSGVGHI